MLVYHSIKAKVIPDSLYYFIQNFVNNVQYAPKFMLSYFYKLKQ